MSNPSVLAVIPAWNEGPRLGPVVEATLRHLPVLVIDDGSEDETASIAERAGSLVMSHGQNRGKGMALVNGFAWALSHGYDAVLTLDADGQHDPGDIPTFLEAYHAHSWDLIIGRRDFSQMPFPRGYSNPLGSWLLSVALGIPIPDNQSGFRLHDRGLLEVLQLTATGFELEVEVIVQAACRGMRIGWVDIQTIYDVDKTSYFHPVLDSARFLGTVWQAWRQRRATTAA